MTPIQKVLKDDIFYVGQIPYTVLAVEGNIVGTYTHGHQIYLFDVVS